MKVRSGHFLSGAIHEPAINWAPILVLTVLITIRIEQWKVEISKSMLSDEIDCVYSIRPVHLKLYDLNNPEAPQNMDGVLLKNTTRKAQRIL